MGAWLSATGETNPHGDTRISKAVYITDPRWQHACSGRNITWQYLNNRGELPWPYSTCPDAGFVLRTIKCDDPMPHCDKSKDWIDQTAPYHRKYKRNNWEGMGDPLTAPTPPPWFPFDGIIEKEWYPVAEEKTHPTKDWIVQYWTSANGVTWHCDMRCRVRLVDGIPEDHYVGMVADDGQDGYKVNEYDCSRGCSNPATHDECILSCGGQLEKQFPNDGPPARVTWEKPVSGQPNSQPDKIELQNYDCQKGCMSPKDYKDCMNYCNTQWDVENKEGKDRYRKEFKRNLPGIPQTVWNTTAPFPQHTWHDATTAAAENDEHPLLDPSHLTKSDIDSPHHAQAGISVSIAVVLSLAILAAAGLYRYRTKRKTIHRKVDPQFSDYQDDNDTEPIELSDFRDH
ncbi:hypothetical protein PVAG01_02594 [Phlyctema vagabunda]|uniref:Uncharacterized protein n=1 Tax=Phlyctema vagabunda TaxID=108571 RepID=A0ABR4PR34_9HELO